MQKMALRDCERRVLLLALFVLAGCTGLLGDEVAMDGAACEGKGCDGGAADGARSERDARAETSAQDAASEAGGDGGETAGPRARGEACTDADDCKSGHCADGVCCNAACDGTCDRCDTGEVGKCELDDGLCGTCGVCRDDGSCEVRASACTGDCSVCQAAGDRFQCAPDQSQCVGDCNACQGSGTAFSCGDTDGLCWACQKCSSGACIDQLPTEDLKDDCVESDCANGLCDGAGACAFASIDTPCESGTCRRCNGSGVCVAAATHDDCATCQMCEAGVCVFQPDETDLKDECNHIPCEARLAGWSSSATGWGCGTFSTTDEAIAGTCDGAGQCYSWESVCSGRAAALFTCASAGCRNECEVGTRAKGLKFGSVCHESGQQGCSAGYVCDSEGACVPE